MQLSNKFTYGNIHPSVMNREQLNQYRQDIWEEHSGSNSRVPQYNSLPNSGYGGGIQFYEENLKRDALEYKRKQKALSRRRFQESFDEEQWRDQYRRKNTYTPNKSAMTALINQYGSMSSKASPAMQNPFQF